MSVTEENENSIGEIIVKKSMIENILYSSLTTGGDFSEVFIEKKKSNALSSSGGKIEDILSGEEFGIGIRIFKNTKSVYVYTNDFNIDNLYNITKEAANILSQSKTKDHQIVLSRIKGYDHHKIKIDPITTNIEDKVNILKYIFHEAKSYNKKIAQVQSSILDYKQDIIIANSEGLHIKDSRTRCRFSVMSIAVEGNMMNRGYFAPGAHKGFEFFLETDYKKYAREASRMAIAMLSAEECPAGVMPVVIDNGFGGVIFHEACGHGLEATSVAKKTSVFTDKIGKSIANQVVTAIDDGSLVNEWGSANYDDEGMKTQKNILIEKGVLKSYLVDKLNSRRMGLKENGSSRRQSYRLAPTSRMSNTYIANGKSTVKEMIGSIDKGLYAKNMGGGSVDPATGEYNFSVLEAYLIENGKVTRPVRGACLIGRGDETLLKIEMVGNNLAFAQGMCGSVSGNIPTNVGQPAIKVSDIVVGGGSI